jgi:hypothetical protein
LLSAASSFVFIALCQHSWRDVLMGAVYLQVLLRMVCNPAIEIPLLPVASDHLSHSPAPASHCLSSVMLASCCMVSLPIYCLPCTYDAIQIPWAKTSVVCHNENE